MHTTWRRSWSRRWNCLKACKVNQRHAYWSVFLSLCFNRALNRHIAFFPSWMWFRLHLKQLFSFIHQCIRLFKGGNSLFPQEICILAKKAFSEWWFFIGCLTELERVLECWFLQRPSHWLLWNPKFTLAPQTITAVTSALITPFCNSKWGFTDPSNVGCLLSLNDYNSTR